MNNDLIKNMERSVLPIIGIDGQITPITQSAFSHINKVSDSADIIMTGIKSDINVSSGNSANISFGDANNSTIDINSNKGQEDITSYLKLNLNSKKPKSAEVKNSFKTISRYKEQLKESTFYTSIKQYSGTVQFIDENANAFTAYLSNIDDEDDELVAEFNFNDVNFASHRELIQLGAMFVWLIGQEVEHGTVTNIAKFKFRRTPVARGKILQEAKDNAREWAKFFDGI